MLQLEIYQFGERLTFGLQIGGYTGYLICFTDHSFLSLCNLNLHLTKAKLRVKAKRILANRNTRLLAKGVQCSSNYPGADFSNSMSFTKKTLSSYSLLSGTSMTRRDSICLASLYPHRVCVSFSTVRIQNTPPPPPLSVTEIIFSLPCNF